MAASKHDKTEAPTPKRKKEARKEGRVVRSQDLVTWVSVLVATMVVPGLIRGMTSSVRELLRSAAAMAERPDAASLPGEVGHAMQAAFMAILPMVAVMGLIGLVANLGQVGFLFSPGVLKPKMGRLNPKEGFKRMFSVKGLWQALTAMAKLTVIGAVVWVMSAGVSDRVLGDRTRSPADAVVQIAQVSVMLVQVVAAVCVLIGVADYAVKRRDLGRELKMTKHEIRQEYKESDGDPHMKSHMRSQRLAMSRNRMLGAVSTADVVITNPTHFAVALSYERSKGAPRVVARGADALAARIREEAKRSGVPCVESKLLARTLYRVTRPGEEIPAELYQAVATVLAFLHRVSDGQGAARRSVGAVYGLDVVDTWTPTAGVLERVSPAQRRRAARRLGRRPGLAAGG